ncbi:MAG: helix-turn-helix domain-containing protein [Bifidobacteriaceae bacterium]|nr:helix-turn-helix domain-containing protein [Bifidobacteriaceae bacterium]
MLLGDAAQWGRVLRTARLDKGWTQAELAARMGVNRKWVMAVEGGAPTARLQWVLDACDHLGLLVDLVPDPFLTDRRAIVGEGR